MEICESTARVEEVRELQRIEIAAAGQIIGTADRHGIALRRIAFVRYLNGTDKPETLSLEKNVFGMNEGPKAEVDKVIGCMRVKGFLSTMQPGGISSGVDKFFEWVGATQKKDSRVYIKDVRMTVTYWPDREGMPDLTQTLSDWSVRSG